MDRHDGTEPRVDRLRRDRVGREKTEALAGLETLDVDDAHEIPDERLRLIFTCCHPALAIEARVALTLGRSGDSRPARSRGRSSCPRRRRAAAGPGQAEDPRQRDPLPGPTRRAPPERLAGVQSVLYLIFNEGYASTEGELIREELCDEAIWLARVIAPAPRQAGGPGCSR